MSRSSRYLLVFFVLSLAGCWLAFRFSRNPVKPEQVTARIQEGIAQEVSRLQVYADSLRNADARAFADVPEQDYFFWIAGDTIAAWNNNRLMPLVLMDDTTAIRFGRMPSGDYLFLKWPHKRAGYIMAVLPLYTHFKISNEYLRETLNSRIFDDYAVSIVEPSEARGIPVMYHGAVKFRIELMQEVQYAAAWILVELALAALTVVLAVVLIFRLVAVVAQYNHEVAFLVLLVAGGALRVLMIGASGALNLRRFVLFDPNLLASSELNPSLGDMLINAIGIYAICHYLFRTYHHFAGLRRLLTMPVVQWVVLIACGLYILFGVLFPVVVIQTIYNNSAFTLSISESIQFDIFRIIVLLVLLFCWASAFLFVHVFLRLMTTGVNTVHFIGSMALSVGIFILINESSGQVYFLSLLSTLVYVIIVLLFQFYKTLVRFQYKTFVYFFVAVGVFAFNAYQAVEHFERKEQRRNQFRFAEFLVDRDYFGEYLLSEVLQKIQSDAFVQARLSNPLLGKDPIRSRIQQYSLPGYFNKYSTEIMLFTPSGDPLENVRSGTFAEILSRYDNEAGKTDYAGVYYVGATPGESSRQYVAVTAVHRGGVLAGYVMMQFSLKRVIPESVYPELLVDSRFQRMYRHHLFSYSVLQNGQVQFRSGEFNVDKLAASVLSDPTVYTTGIEMDGYFHVAAEDVFGKTAIVSSPVETSFQQFAEFSSFFILGVFIVFLFLVVAGVRTVLASGSLFLAARIQLFLNLAFFIPLIAVSAITLGLTARTSQEQLVHDYQDKSRNFAAQLGSTMEHEKASDLDESFSMLVSVSSADANLFTEQGRLALTSQPGIFENQLLSPLLDARALRRMERGDRDFVLSESVGKLKFFVAYSAVYAPETGKLIGIVALPFFQSGALLERTLIAVLSNILVIFTLLFVVLLTASYVVSKWLTVPLRMITQTLGKLSLVKANQPLEWRGDDEIGIMVREYNQMLTKLSESKVELERTQRENAWREIAQQVAHEIKNPLTPMKLTLQQLDKLVSRGEVNAERLEKSVGSLLTQVETLNGIASSFSAFAKMPEPVMADVDLLKLIRDQINLHQEGATIHLDTPLQRAVVSADEQLLSRIIGNMILNGIQAVRAGEHPVITIALTQRNEWFQVDISDNGAGIEPALADKIFLPHFTTKQTGSGLGLAIARQGIDQMGGQISFQSTASGTTFTILLHSRV